MSERILSSTLPVLAVFLALSAGPSLTPARAQCQLAKLLASDGAATDAFGNAVAISDDLSRRAVIGAYGDDDHGSNSGSAYVFSFDGSHWGQQAKLVASDGAANDSFGFAVAIAADTVVVGAYRDDDNGSNSGSAYVFHFDGATWVEQAKLLAPGGATGDNFGISVAVSGEPPRRAVVGAKQDDDNGPDSGSVYAFHFDGSGWVQETKLRPADGTAGDNFGISLAISPDPPWRIVVGAYWDDENGSNSGSAYVFRLDGATWVEEAKLLASDGATADHFGQAVAISADVALIGAPDRDENGLNSGSAYVFRLDGAAWVEDAKLLPSDGGAGDNFGTSVAVDRDPQWAVIGANHDNDHGNDSGSAYVFQFDGASWIEHTKLTACDGQAYDRLGTSVAISGDVVAIGVKGDDDNGGSSGSARLLRTPLRPGDVDGDNDVDLADLASLLGNYGTAAGAGCAEGDIDGDCDVDVNDLLTLLLHYGTVYE